MQLSEDRIKILSPQVVDQIAAGEVVERPSHLVKELIENSLDAGATQIEISFSQGGRQVKVVDNGRGISKEDLKLALTRFATSKIAKTEDIWSLNSFGFRGEALASISAVSKLTLRSRRQGQTQAHEIISEYGILSDVEEISGAEGTSIEIQNLFENLPARLKFLKSTSAESAQIKNVVKAMALANPSVEFKLFAENQMSLFYPKHENHLQRTQVVFDIEELYVGEAEREGVKSLSIFAGPHDVAKSSRNIWIFCQGRWVQDRSLQSAVMEAYRSLLMHGEFPQAVSFVELDPSMVDVNIHPTKSQVKFQNPSLAFRAVQASIRDVLEKAPWIKAQGVEYKAQATVTQAITQFSQSMAFTDVQLDKVQFAKREMPRPETANKAIELELPLEPKPGGGYWSGLEVLAQAQCAYILTQSKDSLVIVDQHAAHERVLFEKIKDAWMNGGMDVQEFLFPLTLDLTTDKIEALLSQSEELQRFGIEMEQLGPESLGVKAAPTLISESALVKVLEQMSLDLIEKGGSYKVENHINDICATLACHSAIRAGKILSMQEMRALLNDMDEFPLSSFCPHGRPVSVTYSGTEIERDFGRIV